MVIMAVQTLTTFLCTLILVVTEKNAVLQVLNDLRYGHKFRQICWNEPARDLLQEQKVQIAILFIGDEGFAVNRNILGLFMDLT